MTDNVAAMLAVVRARPTDWDARRILADAMEEAGDYIGAHGQRWQAENKKNPFRSYAVSFQGDSFDWWRDGAKLKDLNCSLSEEIWTAIGVKELDDWPNCKEFPSIEAAEYALAEVVQYLKVMVNS